MTEFRIEYTIQRMDEGDEDFVDIGFGSSGGWSTINAASYAVESDIQNRSWETEPHMPDPEDAEGEPIHESGDPSPSGPASQLERRVNASSRDDTNGLTNNN